MVNKQFQNVFIRSRIFHFDFGKGSLKSNSKFCSSKN